MPINYLKKLLTINREKQFFPGQEKGEKVIFFTRRHPLSFLGVFLFAFFMAVLPFLFYLTARVLGIIQLSLVDDRIFIVLAGSYLLFVMGFFLAAWIDYYLDVMILTDFRIVDITQNVLFSRSVAEADLADVEDVNAEVKGILPTFFHYGTVFVQTAGTARNFEFNALPNPYNISKMVVELHQKALLEQQEEETQVLGKSITEINKGEKAASEDIHKAAHDLVHQIHRQKKPTNIEPNKENEASAEKQNTENVESDGRKEADIQKPPIDTSSSAQETPKTEIKPKDNNSISHDDLEKGGEAEF